MDTKEEIVAFLGPKASYTHQAAKKSFSDKRYHIVPLTTIEDVFAAVQAGTASYGVVPFENSSNGSVIFTLDLFANVSGHYSDIVVNGEIYLPVHHCLLGHGSKESIPLKNDVAKRHLKDEPESPTVSGQVTPTLAVPQPSQPRVQPLHSLKHLRKIYSHPQAWGQCKLFLATYLKGVERQDVSSTSKAAEFVAQDATGTSAAISSKLAAEMNGLDVLAEGIEDSEGNSTRFFVLRRWQDVEAENLMSNVDNEAKKPQYKSLVSFTVDHSEPGKYTARELLLSSPAAPREASATPVLRCWNSRIDPSQFDDKSYRDKDNEYGLRIIYSPPTPDVSTFLRHLNDAARRSDARLEFNRLWKLADEEVERVTRHQSPPP